jgi:two-component system sensor histidine kinase KdpD
MYFWPDQRQELLQTIYEEAEHLNQIIRNVLDMTRLEAGAIKVKKTWQPLEEIVGAVLNRLDERLKGRPVKISLTEDLPLVSFDPLLIEQVLVNLLDNAIKYTSQEIPIELSAYVKDGEIIVEIEDRGTGIPAGEEEKIFDKFVRGAATGGGIGLGLTICRAIITAHDGWIRAENRQGGGRISPHYLSVNSRQRLNLKMINELTEDKGLILLIEDEPQMRRFLRITLQGHGYRLIEAATGQEGLTQVAVRNPDVVLLDLGLPDIDGLEVTKRLREWSHVPVIVLSAREQEEDKIRALTPA